MLHPMLHTYSMEYNDGTRTLLKHLLELPCMLHRPSITGKQTTNQHTNRPTPANPNFASKTIREQALPIADNNHKTDQQTNKQRN
jgi:hypothetical protein